MIERIVPNEGDPESRVMFIGDYPSADDVRHLKPFSGKVGTLFEALIGATGLRRSECYLSNVLRFQSDAKNICTHLNLRTKVPRESDIFQRHKAALLKDIKNSKANVIVPMGAAALWVVLGLKNLKDKRGYVFEAYGKKVIPTWHPKESFKEYTLRHIIRLDLRKVTKECQSPVLKRIQRNLIIQPDYLTSLHYLENIFNKEIPVGFDIEVKQTVVSHISFAPSSRESISIDFHKNKYTYDEELELWKWIAKILESEKINKIAQNACFDYGELFDHYGIRVKNFDDTMIASAVVIPTYPKSLGFLTSIYTDQAYYKSDLKSTNMKTFGEYSATDSVVLPEIMHALKADVLRLDNKETYDAHIKLIEPLIYMSRRGIRMDIEGMADARSESENILIELKEKLQKYTGEPLNANSPKQLKDYFYIKKGLPPYRSKGKITTDEKAMKRIARKGHIEAEVILNIRQECKFLSSYLNVVYPNGRMTASYNPVGTVNGRISSGKTIFGEGLNVQTLPYRMKKYCLADKGYLIYSVDLSQAENRIVAFIAPEYAMLEAFEKGEDVHCKTAGYIYNMPPDEISRAKGSSGFGDKSQRDMGKMANHALNYGLGSAAFALRLEIPDREGKRIVNIYHAVYPGVRLYHGATKHTLSTEAQRLTNPFNRTRVFIDRWGEQLFNQAYNYIPQSTVADIINRWGLNFIYYDKRFKHVELLNQIHDEIVFQIPIAIGMENHYKLLALIIDSLERPIYYKGRSLIIPADAKVGYNLADMIDCKTKADHRKAWTTLQKVKNA